MCPVCGKGPMKKALNPPAIHFKGTGWAKKERASASVPKAAGARPAEAGDVPAASPGSGSGGEAGPGSGSGSGSSGGGGEAPAAPASAPAPAAGSKEG